MASMCLYALPFTSGHEPENVSLGFIGISNLEARFEVTIVDQLF